MPSSNNYKSPLCCCIICHEIKSAKGIHSHYLTTHTKEGIQRLHDARSRDRKESIRSTRAREVRSEYKVNPSKCSVCETSLTYKQRNNKYCSHNCSAKITNIIRQDSGYSQKDYGAKISETLRSKRLYIKLHQRICKLCNKTFFWSKHNPSQTSRIYCSKDCSASSKSMQASLHFKKLGTGGVRQSKKIAYKGYKLGSSFEYHIAVILDDLNIKWVIPKRFGYTKPDGTTSNYTPDLYLPEYDIYLDPKNNFLIHNQNPGNGIKDIDKIAWAVEQNKITVAIVDEKNLTKEFILKLVGQEGFEPSVILSCKDSGFDHSHHCPILYVS